MNNKRYRFGVCGLSISEAEEKKLIDSGVNKKEIIKRYMFLESRSEGDFKKNLLDYKKHLDVTGQYQMKGCMNKDEIALLLESL